MYRGEDSAICLNKYCQYVFDRISRIQASKYTLKEKEVTILLLLGGDMSYQASVIGRPHVWSFNQFCMKCQANRKKKCYRTVYR